MNSDTYKDLAQILSLNYCDNSINLLGKEEAKSILGDQIVSSDWDYFFRKNSLKDNDQYIPTRVVLVIGAGASSSAYPKRMPTGYEVIEKIEENLNIKNTFYPNPDKDSLNGNNLYDKYLEIKERFRLVWQLEDHKDFESRLATLSNYYTDNTIRNQLKSFFNHRYKPSLLNELIAHLFKHRFVDVIINFNFDETLDQAIEEEMLGGDYHYIYSDGHCLPIEDLTTNNRIKLPIYIKPHGTIKHPSSLKFTKDDYFLLPHDIKKTMYDLISGRVGQSPEHEGSVERTVVITVGYAMKSLEFNDILFRAYEELDQRAHKRAYTISDVDKIDVNRIWAKSISPRNALEIYHFNYALNAPPSAGNKPWEQIIDRCGHQLSKKMQQDAELGEKIERKYWIPNGFFCKEVKNSSQDEVPLDKHLHNLWLKTTDCFKNDNIISYYPRGISRHLLIDLLFRINDTRVNLYYRHPSQDWNTDDNDESLWKYAEDRTAVELVIALAKSKGIIDLSQLMRERVGIYYELYRNEYNKFKRKAQKDAELNKTSISKDYVSPPKSISEFCSKLGLNVPHSMANAHGFPKDVFKLDIDRNIKETSEEINIRHKLYNILHSYFTNEVKSLPRNWEEKSEDGEKSKVESYLDEMINSYSNDIRAKFRGRRLSAFQTFSTSKIQHTSLALRYRTTKFIENGDWDVILLVTERSKFISNTRELLEKVGVGKSSQKLNDEKTKKRFLHIIQAQDTIGAEENSNLSSFYKDNEVIIRDTISGSSLENIYRHSVLKETDANSYMSNNCEVLYLPYWLHHHHMMIFMKRVIEEPNSKNSKKSGWKVNAALYYHRDGLSNLINPIWIDRCQEELNHDNEALDDDYMMLLQIYYLYRVMSNKKSDIIKISSHDQLNRIQNTENVHNESDLPFQNYIHNDYMPKGEVINGYDTALYSDTISWLNTLKDKVEVNDC